jgi:membrane-associated phospholipid phosphatase
MLAALHGSARADDGDDDVRKPDDIGPSYLIDGGAIPLFWMPAIGSLVLSRWPEARDTPLGFDHDEGGAPSEIDEELPAWTIAAATGVLGVSILAGDDPSRYHHVKGLAETTATATLAVKLGKVAFGRHRPDYDPREPGDGGRRSFPSGHATHAAAAAMYAGLYLRYHVFDDLRPDGSTLPWWEGATYVGLAALVGGIAYERVDHNRHHKTDVLAGTLLGAGTAIAIFAYQERRYRADKRAADSDKADTGARLAPATDGVGFTYSGTF